MAYTPITWERGDVITVSRLNHMEEGIDYADETVDGIKDTVDSLEEKAAASAVIDDVSSGMEATTEPIVLVKNDDSRYGNGDPMVFTTQPGPAIQGNGIDRANARSVYPLAGLGSLPTANAPRRRLMGIIRTWIGRTNFVHTSNTGTDTTTLFGDDCQADSNGKFHLDCSAFVCAVLMGITYEKSRYVLGKSAENLVEETGEFFTFPPSVSGARTKGGLYTFELAKYFAERKLLFNCPKDVDQFRQTLKFGDILFVSSSYDQTDPGYFNTYYNIGHCAFVLGTVGDFIMLAECSGSIGSKEPSNIHFAMSNISSYLSGDHYRVFARPDYKKDEFGSWHPIADNGKTVIRDVLTPGMEIYLGSSDNPPANAGMIRANTCFSACEGFIPVTPGSVVYYTGNTSNTRGLLSCRIHQYDENYHQVRRGQTLMYLGQTSGANASPVTIEATTRYIRPSFGWLQGCDPNNPDETNSLWFSDMDDFEITIRTDSGVEVITL